MMTSKAFRKQLSETVTAEGEHLIYEFFITFSRFECALKVSGFANGSIDRVNPNWDTFTASIRETFDSEKRNVSIAEAIDYLTVHPPKVQNYESQQLSWRDRVFQQSDPLINRLSLSIRDVRNNLFHGGKFDGTYQEDVSRNYILLQHSIEMLNFWLELSPNVRETFLQPIA